jgi:hypothetical protein
MLRKFSQITKNNWAENFQSNRIRSIHCLKMSRERFPMKIGIIHYCLHLINPQAIFYYEGVNWTLPIYPVLLFWRLIFVCQNCEWAPSSWFWVRQTWPQTQNLPRNRRNENVNNVSVKILNMCKVFSIHSENTIRYGEFLA